MKKSLMSLALLFSLSVPLLSLTKASALFEGSSEVACEGIQLTDTASDCSEEPTKVNSALETVVDIFSFVVGVVAVIMIIIGGLKYVTSTGDAGSAASARNTIIYAVVGLVVVVLAQFIVKFTVNKTAQGSKPETTESTEQ